MNGRPKVYMGRDGFKGVSRIGQSSYLEKMAGPQKKSKVYSGGAGVSIHRVLANGGIVGGGMVRVRSETAKPIYMGGKGRAEALRGEEKPRETALKIVKPRFPIIPPKKEEAEMATKVEVTFGSGDSSPRVVNEPKCEKKLEELSKLMAEMEMKFIEADAKAEKPGGAEVRKSMMEMAREPQPNLAAAVDRNPPKAVEAVGVYAPAEVGMTETEERLTDFLAAAQEVVSPTEDGKADPPAETEETIAARVEESKTEGMRLAFPELPQGEDSLEGGKKRRKRKNRKPRASTEMPEAERAAIQAEIEEASETAAEVQ